MPEQLHRDVLRSDDSYGLLPEFVSLMHDALESENDAQVLELVEPLHYADVADLIENLDRDDRARFVRAIKSVFNAEVLPELDDAVREEVIEELGFEDFAACLREVESDDAVYLVGQIEDDDERAAVLAKLPAELRSVIEQALALPEYSAGRLMQRELVAVPSYWTVGETIDYLRSGARLPDEFYQIFIVDPRHRPVGSVRLSALLRSRRPVRLSQIMESKAFEIPVTMDQEEVAFLFRQQDLLSAPVVDASGRLVGRITVDDVVDVIDEEAEDDMFRLAGLSERDLFSAVVDTVKSRSTWLILNLGTAVLASLVIGLFESTLQAVVALAVLMPIVASMGGNAGTQTLTIAVRALATKELTAANAMRIVGKETVVGLINGVVFALLTGAVSYLWFGDMAIGLVIGAAMIINMLAAALAGIAIPLALERLKVDPAVSSGVFLTTVTDVVGFFAFLGLAAAFIL
ncbi:magnesium transporter [Roseospira marina]|uniref:Magnesium transporter MgtE n=1 Tax=Roseospira marina TaxID=140057 RepID=A0A5M6IGC1_9PROT|nr:magnesium transporter [Roseospira marina]KAA5606937.1 magnesium transporter [Roseospira marina]MBB4312889.1 magnesium transporter [Roseospira marina]MBB5086338.1 magnesium transporter [Roseospira marina]